MSHRPTLVCAPMQVAAAVADAVGPELTGIRLSPYSDFQEAMDPETLELNLYLVDKASEMGLLYVHAVESRISGGTDAQAPQSESLDPLRNAFKASFLAASYALPCLKTIYDIIAARFTSLPRLGACQQYFSSILPNLLVFAFMLVHQGPFVPACTWFCAADLCSIVILCSACQLCISEKCSHGSLCAA